MYTFMNHIVNSHSNKLFFFLWKQYIYLVLCTANGVKKIFVNLLFLLSQLKHI